MPDKRVTLREASALLGVSEGAIRKRVARKKIRSEMGEDGLRYVWVPEAEAGTDGGADEGRTKGGREAGELVEELRDRVRHLERQLEQAARRDEENRRVILALTSRIPAIEAPRERQEGAQEPSEAPGGAAEPRSDTVGTQEDTERPWWRRVFGG